MAHIKSRLIRIYIVCHYILLFDSTQMCRHKKKKRFYVFPVWGYSNANVHDTIWATDMRLFLKLPQGLYYMSANSKGSGAQKP